MPAPLPDYYGMLELPPSASAEEIKRRYRELARRYHPDVNPSPEAAQRIKSVNEAHRVLGDPDRRSLYDAERALNPPSTRPQVQHAAPAREPQQRPHHRPQTGRPGAAGHRVEFNGFGRVPRDHRPETRRQPVAPKPSTAKSSEAAYKLVSEAQIAFLTRNYSDASYLCRQALDIDNTSAGAHEVLGDVFAIRGDTDAAIKSYSYAIQFNPRSYSVQGKLDRLVGKGPHAGRGPAMSRKGGPKVAIPKTRGYREAVLALISAAAFAGACAVLAVFSQSPGLAIGGSIPWITSLTPNLMVALVIEGVIGGVLLAFYGKLRPIADEFSGGPGARTGKSVPLLAILTMFSLVWFYASLLIYLCVAVGRNRHSSSLVRVFSLVLLEVALFTAMGIIGDRGGWLETAAFAGNLLFPAALIGWLVGDCVRLRLR